MCLHGLFSAYTDLVVVVLHKTTQYGYQQQILKICWLHPHGFVLYRDQQMMSLGAGAFEDGCRAQSVKGSAAMEQPWQPCE